MIVKVLILATALGVLGAPFVTPGRQEPVLEAFPLTVAQAPVPALKVPAAPPVAPPKRFIYGPVVYVVTMRVTACSPGDPLDKDYYARNGYEGDAYGIAAFKPYYPEGTEMRIPGYMKTTWETVDSSGGSVIRRSTRRGSQHIDVKYRTVHSARAWGTQKLDVEVVLPPGALPAQHARLRRIAKDSYPRWVKEVQ